MLLSIALVSIGGARRIAAADERSVIVLINGDPATSAYYQRFAEAFRRHPAMQGRPVHLLAVQATGDDAALGRTVAAAVARRPSVIVAPNGTQSRLAHELAPDIPLVFATQTDPRELGIASELVQRPEASTGIWMKEELLNKRIEMLMDAYPTVRVIAAIGDADWYQAVQAIRPQLTALARQRGVELRLLGAASTDEALRLIESPAVKDVQAWCVSRSMLTFDGRLLRRMSALGMATMAGHTPDMDEGAQMSYSFDRRFFAATLADLAARVLAGERPGSIPIQLPERVQLVVRVPTDPRLPPLNPDMVRRADWVIR